MSGRKPPSKPVLIAAILPLFIAVAGMIAFSYFVLPIYGNNVNVAYSDKSDKCYII